MLGLLLALGRTFGVNLRTTCSRYLAYELRYLLDCPRLRKLHMRTGRTTVMCWEKDWTGVLKELQLKKGKRLEVIYAKPELDLRPRRG